MPSAPPPPARAPEDGAIAADGGSFLLRFGTGVGAGVVAAAVAVFPATLRVAHDGGGVARAWAACVALALVPMLVAVWVLRRARVGMRAFAGDDASARAIAFAVWIAISFVVFATFGSVLRATTHHHALAGVTFAIVGLVVLITLGLFASRFAVILGARQDGARRVFFIATVAALLLVGGLMAMRFTRALGASSAEPSTAAPLVIDVLAFGIAAVFASKQGLSDRRPLAMVGVPAAIVLFAAGLITLHASVELANAILGRAPLLGAVASLVTSR